MPLSTVQPEIREVLDPRIVYSKGGKELAQDTTQISISSLEHLNALWPYPVADAVKQQAIELLAPLVGKILYLSELAELVVPFAFHTLSAEERTQNNLYILLSLAQTNERAKVALAGFYYIYAFEAFVKDSPKS